MMAYFQHTVVLDVLSEASGGDIFAKRKPLRFPLGKNIPGVRGQRPLSTFAISTKGLPKCA